MTEIGYTLVFDNTMSFIGVWKAIFELFAFLCVAFPRRSEASTPPAKLVCASAGRSPMKTISGGQSRLHNQANISYILVVDILSSIMRV